MHGRFQGPFHVSLSAFSLGAPSIPWLPCQVYWEDSKSTSLCACLGCWAPGHRPSDGPHSPHRLPELSVTPTLFCFPSALSPKAGDPGICLPTALLSISLYEVGGEEETCGIHPLRCSAFTLLPCGYSSLCLSGSFHLVPAVFLCIYVLFSCHGLALYSSIPRPPSLLSHSSCCSHTQQVPRSHSSFVRFAFTQLPPVMEFPVPTARPACSPSALMTNKSPLRCKDLAQVSPLL